MHACGHDGHIAIGLGVASVLAPLVRESGAGRLRLLFQPAEEGVRGGRALVDAGWVGDVDLLLGFHIGFGVPAGTIAVGVRGFLATEKLRVRLTGRAAHAGKAPERGRNALIGACQIALGLHALAQSSAPGLRVNVGRLEAGRALNIVADQAELLVELRAERSDDLRDLSLRARRLIEGIAASGELGHFIELIGEAADWANPAALVAWAGEIARRSGAFERVLEDHVFGASEDATLLARAVAARGGQAGYFLLGANLNSDHHTPEFDFDEEVLSRGVAARLHGSRPAAAGGLTPSLRPNARRWPLLRRLAGRQESVLVDVLLHLAQMRIHRLAGALGVARRDRAGDLAVELREGRLALVAAARSRQASATRCRGGSRRRRRRRP